jgi:hypothetical protein
VARIDWVFYALGSQRNALGDQGRDPKSESQVPVITETPAVVDFTREDFDRAWRLDTEAPHQRRARPETAIVLQRNSPNDFQDRQIYVFVDGEAIGKIRYGQALNHPIEPGEHTVRVFNTLLSQTITIKAAPGEQVRLQCGNGMPTAGWLMMIFLHVTYLRVWISRDTA